MSAQLTTLILVYTPLHWRAEPDNMDYLNIEAGGSSLLIHNSQGG